MSIIKSKRARALVLLAVAAGLSGCGLPRSGPTKREIYSSSVQRQGDAFVVEVNDEVTRATAVAPAFGFSSGFQNAGLIGSDDIRPGDQLGLTIWENVDDGLLSSQGTSSSRPASNGCRRAGSQPSVSFISL